MHPSLLIMIVIPIVAIAVGSFLSWVNAGFKARQKRLELIERALADGRVDPRTRDELLRSLAGGPERRAVGPQDAVRDRLARVVRRGRTVDRRPDGLRLRGPG